jgi:hypothetical protein
MIKIKKIKIYHIRTLLLTYLVWAALNLYIASLFCEIAKVPLTWMPYYWGLLHIVPLMLFLPTEINSFGIAPLFVLIIAAVFVTGLLRKERWGCYLIIIGMSLWFFGAACLIGIGA